ncbi:hypothetical protein MFIFM68171_02539 [Madurella fahalii]|uniref:Uncharacterized protein n=1 Tax=Madurella fahalii TaxID=1157608 RepID=A0ABQ0G3T4_9PEZI
MTTSAMLDIPGSLVLLEKTEIAKLRKTFFPPLILLTCLNGVCPQGPSQKASDSPRNPNQSPREMFHTLVNKLAQICDFQPGGDTVTAVAVIRLDGRICYVLASNRRSTAALSKACAGLAAVLDILKSNLEVETRDSDEMVEKRLMQKILDLNTVRVGSYLTSLSKNLQMCLTKCDDNTPEGRAAKEALEKLSRTIPDSNKDDEKSDNYINATMQCIMTIQENRKSPSQRYIEERAVEDYNMGKGGCWSSLQHVTGRLLSYKYAVQTIVHAHYIWANTDLFREFDIASVRSSQSYPTEALKFNPETAEAIINRAPGHEQARIQVYKEHAASLQPYGLNVHLEEKLQQKLEPIVHAEMLLHEWLSRTEGGTQPYRFFQNWQYIGSSKPVCRLCMDYFNVIATPVSFRSEHPNTYLNWRLPDMYVNSLEDEASVERERKAWRATLGQMKRRVYAAIVRVLEEKVSEKKSHDSNTYTERITTVKDVDNLANWLEGVQLRGGPSKQGAT